MPGYDEMFIGVRVPLPTLDPSIKADILHKPNLRDEIYRDFENYAIAMDARRRTALVVAANINQQNIVVVDSGGWRYDRTIGKKNQLGNDYYKDNEFGANRWDRGHLANRASSAWGLSENVDKRKKEATLASKDTMVYANASLQWEDFNKDEWQALENWVRSLKEDRSNLISVFTGPIFGEQPVFHTFPGLKPAEIPAGFFKVVCFEHKDHPGLLAVRAFIIYQDAQAMADRQGRHRVNLQAYQVSVKEIQDRTGLRFDQSVIEANSLLYSRRSEGTTLRVRTYPERIPVDIPEDVTDPGQQRRNLEDDVDVYITACLPNPVGRDRGREWVMIHNFSADQVNIKGWTVQDNAGFSLPLEGHLAPYASLRLLGEALGAIQLNNRGDILTLWDTQMNRIARAKYQGDQVQEGRPVVF